MFTTVYSYDSDITHLRIVTMLLRHTISGLVTISIHVESTQWNQIVPIKFGLGQLKLRIKVYLNMVAYMCSAHICTCMHAFEMYYWVWNDRWIIALTLNLNIRVELALIAALLMAQYKRHLTANYALGCMKYISIQIVHWFIFCIFSQVWFLGLIQINKIA